MFGTLAHFSYRRRWYVLGAWLVLLVVAGGLASQVGSVLGRGDFAIKNSESATAAAFPVTRLNLAFESLKN